MLSVIKFANSKSVNFDFMNLEAANQESARSLHSFSAHLLAKIK